jgi:hypothetical protein
LKLDELEAQAMTTVDKFRDAVTQHFAWARKVVWAIFTAGLLVFGWAWLSVQVLVPEGFTKANALLVLIFGLVLVTFLAISLGVWCNEHRSRSDTRLACPRCRRPLQIPYAAVIATGDCPHCGCPVLADLRYGKKQLWLDNEL